MIPNLVVLVVSGVRMKYFGDVVCGKISEDDRRFILVAIDLRWVMDLD